MYLYMGLRQALVLVLVLVLVLSRLLAVAHGDQICQTNPIR